MEESHSPLISRPAWLMPIGGAEQRTTQSHILKQFITRAGGNQARVVVIPTASSFADELGIMYSTLFREIGAAEVYSLHVQNRQQANDACFIRCLTGATGIFLTGGDQMKLLSLIGGTLLADKLTACYATGAVIAGTSAGASALSRHMIAFGRSGSTPSQRMVQLAPGLGLIDRIIVDQHFRQRDRIGRLMTAVAFNPALIGVGIDEDTAFVIGANHECEVIGSGSVTIVDGTAMQYTDLYAVKRHAPVAVMGMKVHILTHGCRYNLASLEPKQALVPQLIGTNAAQPDVLPNLAST